MLRQLPFILIYSRILIGIIIGAIAVAGMDHAHVWIVVLMSLGLVTDIFDGIIARKLNVSSEKLRIWDSNVDVFFWLITIASIFYLTMDFVTENLLWIGAVVLLEFLCYVFSFLKFRQTIATHSILAKIWTLSLLAFLIDLTLHSTSQVPFVLCIALGIISRLEILLIVVQLKQWATDVPSIFSVSKINQGIPIRKNKLFNG